MAHCSRACGSKRLAARPAPVSGWLPRRTLCFVGAFDGVLARKNGGAHWDAQPRAASTHPEAMLHWTRLTARLYRTALTTTAMSGMTGWGAARGRNSPLRTPRGFDIVAAAEGRRARPCGVSRSGRPVAVILFACRFGTLEMDGGEPRAGAPAFTQACNTPAQTYLHSAPAWRRMRQHTYGWLSVIGYGQDKSTATAGAVHSMGAPAHGKRESL